MNKEILTLDKESFDYIMQLLDLKDLKCSICGVKINKDNFGYISKEVYSCNDIICLFKVMDKEDMEQK